MQASIPAYLRRLIATFAIVLVTGLAVLAGAQPVAAQEARNNIAADLVAEHAPVPGEMLTLALRFRPDDGWHGYWSNPGDAGLGMQIDCTLP